jgi:phage-related protein
MVRQGRQPDDCKPMPRIGPGAMEIRIHKPHEHRVIYIAKFPEAVYILSAFEKKTPKTPQPEIDKARKAYAETQRIRQMQTKF